MFGLLFWNVSQLEVLLVLNIKLITRFDNLQCLKVFDYFENLAIAVRATGVSLKIFRASSTEQLAKPSTKAQGTT